MNEEDKVVLLLVGCCGCGKTTYCDKNLNDYYRISQDEMGKEGALQNFKDAVKRGEPKIVVDRMNFNVFQRKRWIENAPGYKIKVLIFNTDKVECTRRAKARTEHPTLKEDKVDAVVEMFYREFEAPSGFEGIHDMEII